MSNRKSKIATSMRGEEVNFDVAEIKNRILSEPEPEISKQRALYVDHRRKRVRAKADELLAEQRNNEASVRAAIAEQKRKLLDKNGITAHEVVDDIVVEETTKEKRKIVKEEK